MSKGPVVVDQELLEAWLQGDLELFRQLLSQKANVLDHLYLITDQTNEPTDSFIWKWSLLGPLMDIFIDVCDKQHVESLEIEKLLVSRQSVAEYKGQTNSEMQKWHSLYNQVINQRKLNSNNCRRSLAAFWLCSGRNLKDLNRLIVKDIWDRYTTRVSDVWKIEGQKWEWPKVGRVLNLNELWRE